MTDEVPRAGAKKVPSKDPPSTTRVYRGVRAPLRRPDARKDDGDTREERPASSGAPQRTVSGSVVRQIVEEEASRAMGPVGKELVAALWRNGTPRNFAELDPILGELADACLEEARGNLLVERVTQRVLSLR